MTHEALTVKQAKLVNWGVECFGFEHMNDPRVRAMRLLEEALEFAQSVKCPIAQCSALVDYVYSRPAGDPIQELGGIGVTWLVAADSLAVSAEGTLDLEIERISQKHPSHFAARNKQKLDAGFTGGGAGQ